MRREQHDECRRRLPREVDDEAASPREEGPEDLEYYAGNTDRGKDLVLVPITPTPTPHTAEVKVVLFYLQIENTP